MDYDDYDDNGWMSDEDTEFRPDIGAFERTGGGLLGTKGEKEKKHLQDPIEKFSVAVDAISRLLNDVSGITIEQKDIDKMVESAYLLKNIEFKNPSAYVLGYLASKGGRNIEKSTVDNVFKKALSHTKGVLEPDVIKYAKLWLKLGK